MSEENKFALDVNGDLLEDENKEQVSKFMEKEQGGFRKLSKFWYVIAAALSFILVTFYLYGAGVAPVSDQYHRGIYILITFLLVFIFFPFTRTATLKTSYVNSIFLNVVFLLGLLWWISSSFSVDAIKAKDDLGYIVHYSLGAILFTYFAFIVRNIGTLYNSGKNEKLKTTINYIFLAFAIGISFLWIFEFSSFVSLGEEINKESTNKVISVLGYSVSLGSARPFIGWFLSIGGSLVLVYFFLKPFLPKSMQSTGSTRPMFSDIVFIIGAFISVGYWVFIYVELASRIGLESDLDFLVSIIGIIISLEVTRRVLGWSLTLFGIIFLAYSYFGAYDFIPGLLQHGGNSIKEVFTSVFINKHGTFGIMAYVLATYVILFIFFGAFLEKSGSTNFFIEFALSAAGKRVGGPAKVSVIASALFGSISGSAIANTVSTGIFTIPLMKRAGFRPHVAGAIEPSASIAGMFLPPIMGAGGFIMAEMTETAYSTIMLVAIFPAIMYILGVFAMIHFEAKKYHLTGMAAEKIQLMKTLILREGYLATPLIVITWLMIRAYSPGYAAFYGVISCILVSLVHKSINKGNNFLVLSLLPIPIKIGLDVLFYIILEFAPSLAFIDLIYTIPPVYIFLLSGILFFTMLLFTKATRDYSLTLFKEVLVDSWGAIQNGARQTLVIGATVGVIGIIVGVIYQTGIGLKFSQIILKSSTTLAEGFANPVASLFNIDIATIMGSTKIVFTVILIAFASLILGMGVPVTAAYVITVSLVSVALQELGVVLIAAHMIVYWFSQDSNITPPVCIAAYAGAAIAGSNPWQTGWTAFKFAKMLYVMPLLFAFVPEILLVSPEGVYFDVSFFRVILIFGSTILGTISFAALTQGFLARKTKLWEFILLIPITILAYWPELISTIVAVTLFMGIYYIQMRRPIDPLPKNA